MFVVLPKQHEEGAQMAFGEAEQRRETSVPPPRPGALLRHGATIGATLGAAIYGQEE